MNNNKIMEWNESIMLSEDCEMWSVLMMVMSEGYINKIKKKDGSSVYLVSEDVFNDVEAKRKKQRFVWGRWGKNST